MTKRRSQKELAFPLNFKRNSISKPIFLDFNEDDNYVQKNLESEDEEINYSLLLEGRDFILLNQFIFEINVGKNRIQNRTTLNYE